MTSPDVMAALRLMEGGRLREAALKTQTTPSRSTNAADVLQAEAMVAMRRGDFVTAESACAAWEHCMPSQPLPKARLGTAQLHQGRFDDARSTLDQALVDHPNDPHLTRAPSRIG